MHKAAASGYVGPSVHLCTFDLGLSARPCRMFLCQLYWCPQTHVYELMCLCCVCIHAHTCTVYPVVMSNIGTNMYCGNTV